MEKVNIKLNDLSPKICLLIEKIQMLDSYALTKQQKLACCKDMSEVVDDLRLFFKKALDCKTDETFFVEKIERAFSLFEWNANVVLTPYEFHKFSENGKVLISSILKLLGTKGCGILIIETYVKLCLKTLFEMTKNVESKNLSLDKSNFKALLEGFYSAANMLKKYWHISFSMCQKNNIMLCLHQICKILPYLLKMVELQYIDFKKYLLNALTNCLNKIQEEIHNDGDLKPNGFGQEFIAIMDFCLHKLSTLSSYTNDFSSFIEKANETSTALKPVIDELLCCVMSIAQVSSFKEDHSAILEGSEKVLKELSELNKEIREENGSAIKLNASSLGESLCSLEQKVNTAVLKLVLEVFSNINSPLKNILNKCRMDIAKNNKASDDLNVLISDFDSEMDRIIQIAFFAVSCTTDTKRILKIQSCLASLESLEAELIPSLTSLYIDCNDKNKTRFQCLFDFWLNEITELKDLIDSVLDPAGFCGVVKNQVENLGLAVKENSTSSNICLNKLKHNLTQAIRYSKKLLRTLKTSMEDENEIFIKTIDENLRKFQLAIQECEAVLDLLDEGKDSTKTTNQAIKRFDFLMCTLDKLSLKLFFLVCEEESKSEEKVLESTSEVTRFPTICIPQKNYYKLCDISTITDSSTNSIPEVLTPYVNKGILRSKKRNLLHIPSKECEDYLNMTVLPSRQWDKTPVSSKRSRCCKPLTLNLELENTVDLEITTILENISQLSNSFSKTLRGDNSDRQENENEKKENNFKEVSCGSEKETDDTKPTYKSSGCCTNFGLEDDTESEVQENGEDEKKFIGFKLRNDFLQALNDLSHKDSLLLVNDSETPSCVDSPDRMNDLKIVDEKINFLKARMPFGPL